VIRKKLWKVPDLYEPTGIYWFTGGWNLRCLAALILGMMPALPGFIMNCIDTTTDNAAVRIFQIAYFVCCPLSLIIYFALNYIWPVEGKGVQKFILPEDNPRTMIEGVVIDGDEKNIGVHEIVKNSSSKEDISL
jgi:NCS1 family nucleobase:cation symporter-1